VRHSSTWPVTILAMLLLLWIAKPVLVPILLAILLAQLLSPLVNRLERFLPGGLAVLVAMGLLAAVIWGAVALVGNQLSILQSTLPTISKRISHIAEATTLAFGRIIGLGRTGQTSLFERSIEGSLDGGGSAALSAITFTLSTVAEAALIVILTFLMLLYRRHFRRQLKRLGERNGAWGVVVALDRTAELSQSYVAGLGLVMLIVGFADTMGLLLVDAPFPAVFGLLGGLSVLVPYVGISIVAPLCAVVTWLTTGSGPHAGSVLAVFAVVHFLEGNVISPFLVGGKVNLNPLATIVAVLLGGKLWGPAGMVLFIPLTGILRVTLDGYDAAEPLVRLLGPISADDAGPSRRPPRRRLRGLRGHRAEPTVPPAAKEIECATP
jgi:predicted PurR-regulated permease PerM